MIMPRGQQLLLPANPTFMLLTLLIALLLDMVQSMALFGNAAWTPDWVALLLLFWGVHQPLKVGVGVSFFLGLLTDVHQTSLLGQHALAYTVQGLGGDIKPQDASMNHGRQKPLHSECQRMLAQQGCLMYIGEQA